jgi:hypothetical protein
VFRRTNLPEHLFTYDEMRRWPEAEREALLRLGLLRRADDADSVVCETCGESEEVRSDLGPEPRVYCPQLGLMPVSQERLQQWDVDFQALARLLRAGLNLAGTVEELAPGRAWILGRRVVIDRPAEFFLVHGIAWPDSINLLRSAARIQSSPAPLILVPDRLPTQPEWRESGRTLFRLSEWTRLLEGQLLIDFDAFATLRHQAATDFEKPLTPTPVAQRPALIQKFRKDHSCPVKDVYGWANVGRAEFNKWTNGDPSVPESVRS